VLAAAGAVVGCGGGKFSAANNSDASDLGPTVDASSDANSEGSANDDGGAVVELDVNTIPGVVLWLRADQGVTTSSGVVTQWADQSGNHNNAAESRAGLQPGLVTDAIHGLPAVRFSAGTVAATTTSTVGNGNDLLFAATPTFGWSTGDFLIEVVAGYDNTPSSDATQENAVGYGDLFVTILGSPINSATSGMGLYGNAPPLGTAPASTAVFGYVAGAAGGAGVASSTTGNNDRTPHCFALQRVGTTLSVRVDGTEAGAQTIAATTDLGATGTAHLGGVGNAAGQRLDGDIAEVIAVKGTTTPTDLAELEDYLLQKYGLR
jgi:hypothetical protein